MAPDGTTYTQERVRFEERSTGFSVVASPDFRLTYDPARGVYELRSEQRDAAFSYCLLAGAGEPIDEARAAAAQLGLDPYAEQHDDRVGVVEAKSGAGARWTVRAERDDLGNTRLMAYGMLSDGSGSPIEAPDDVYVLNAIFPTAQGGAPVAVEPAAARAVDPPPLQPRGPSAQAEKAPPAEIVVEPTDPEPPLEPAPAATAQPAAPASPWATPGGMFPISNALRAAQEARAAKPAAPAAAQPAQPEAQPAQPAAAQPAQPAAQPAQPAQPAAAPAPGTFPLKDVKTPDGSIGKVPDDPSWTVELTGGVIRAVKEGTGEMWLGLQTNVSQPGELAMYAAQTAQMYGGAPGGGQIVAPWMTADQAVVQIWPRILNQFGAAYGNVRIEKVERAQNNQWASYGDFWITYEYAGTPWRGGIRMSTTPVAWIQAWQLACNWIGIPQSGDEAVLQGLYQAAQAYQQKAQAPDPELKKAQGYLSGANASGFSTLGDAFRNRQQVYDRVFM